MVSLRNKNTVLFDRLFAEFQKPVYRFARYLTRNRDEADELFQETWLRIVQRLPAAEAADNQKAWIMTVTANLYKDLLRKKRIRSIMSYHPFLSGADKDQNQAEIAPSHNEDPARFEVGEAIRESLARLPGRQRQVFVLKEVEGYKHHEIAEILRLPTGTVKSLLYRAVKRLQKDLAEFNEVEYDV